MYNAHRGLMQPPPHVPPGNRITELLEQIRMEFENQASQLSQAGQSREFEQHREGILRQQVDEMQMMRDRVQQLERTHHSMQESYDKKIAELQRELEMRGGQQQPQRHPASHQPPTIGHGPRDLFGQIMAGGAQGSSLAPPPQEPQQPQGLPVHLNQTAGLNTGPQPPQHQPFPNNYQTGGVNGYPGPPPPINHSPGLGKSGRRPPPGPTPSQSAPLPYTHSPRGGHAATPPPPPGRQAHAAPPAPLPHGIQDIGNELGLMKPDDLPANLKKQGNDWYAVFNPQAQRQLDVSLVHTLEHDSVVCCVRFSADGRYVATGCNRLAQIYDVESGKCVASLEDETGEKEGDLYIRSVCFSPDGKFLATGAEDRCIRVWDIAARSIVHTFVGHEQDIYSLDFARNGRLIASGSGDRTVKLWDLETKQERLTLVIEEGVTTVALSPDGRLVAAGSLDRSVRVWDTESGMRMESLEGPPASGHGDSVYSVAFSPSGRELVSGSLDKTIKMWELSRADARGAPQKGLGRCIRTFEGHSDFVLSVALTPGGEWVLSGSKDRGVVFWDPTSGIPQLHLQGHRNSVISVAPCPMKGLFATGSGDATARIWRYEPFRG